MMEILDLLAAKKQRPIQFSLEMVKAILAGRKTQTRRLIKQDDISLHPDIFRLIGTSLEIEMPRLAIPYDDRIYYQFEKVNSNVSSWILHCPYGKAGDVLWVRETFAESCLKDVYLHRADSIGVDEPKWKSSRYMPKKACRLFLEITSVRAERLMDISEEDAIAEGIEEGKGILLSGRWKNYKPGGLRYLTNPIDSFQSLWQSIHGDKAWFDNQWVWVIEFKVLAVKSSVNLSLDGFTTQRPQESGWHDVLWEPNGLPEKAYITVSEHGILWGKNENDDPEAIELDLANPALIQFKKIYFG